MAAPGPLRLVLADEHRLYADAVASVLERDGRFRVVATAHTGSQVTPLVSQVTPDVLLTEVRLPEADGFVCAARVQRSFPGVRVVVLADDVRPSSIDRMLELGVRGYVDKSISPEKLPDALWRILEAAEPVVIVSARPADQAAEALGLTPREAEIAEGVARGLSNEEVARQLHVTEQTVKFHLTNIYRKLGVANRTELAARAIGAALIDPFEAGTAEDGSPARTGRARP